MMTMIDTLTECACPLALFRCSLNIDHASKSGTGVPHSKTLPTNYHWKKRYGSSHSSGSSR